MMRLRCHRPASRLRSDAGAGTVLMVSVAMLAITLVAIVVPVTALLIGWQQLAATADSAALAAADTLRGLRPGEPCAVAERVAAANSATVGGCIPEPEAISVSVTATVLGVGIEVTARAGAPWLRVP